MSNFSYHWFPEFLFCFSQPPLVRANHWEVISVELRTTSYSFRVWNCLLTPLPSTWYSQRVAVLLIQILFYFWQKKTSNTLNVSQNFSRVEILIFWQFAHRSHMCSISCCFRHIFVPLGKIRFQIKCKT